MASYANVWINCICICCSIKCFQCVAVGIHWHFAFCHLPFHSEYDIFLFRFTNVHGSFSDNNYYR